MIQSASHANRHVPAGRESSAARLPNQYRRCRHRAVDAGATLTTQARGASRILLASTAPRDEDADSTSKEVRNTPSVSESDPCRVQCRTPARQAAKHSQTVRAVLAFRE